MSMIRVLKYPVGRSSLHLELLIPFDPAVQFFTNEQKNNKQKFIRMERSHSTKKTLKYRTLNRTITYQLSNCIAYTTF